ncbi:MAG: hypothetical protein R3C01_04310 [Planctomycetaceae bacterium]
MQPDEQVLATLPAGAEIRQIQYVSERTAQQVVVVEFPLALNCRAIRVGQDKGVRNEASQGSSLSLLMVPTTGEGPVEGELGRVLGQMREWVDSGVPASEVHQVTDSGVPAGSLLLTLQGVQMFWSPNRIAILAAPDRFDTLQTAVAEATYYEAQVRDIERSLGAAWPQLEADLPLAFEFDARSLTRNPELRNRFSEVVKLRARMTRIAPHVHSPHVYPPTLVSQVGERLRERTKLATRHEFLSDQLEVFQDVYVQCSDRSSDFRLTRSGNTLEWIIIILLLVQVLMYGVDILTNTGQ